MKKTVFFILLTISTFSFVHGQEIPEGNYVSGTEYFRFLPDHKLEYYFSDEAKFPGIYQGSGSYTLSDGYISILPDMPSNKPDSIIKRTSRAGLENFVDISINYSGQPLTGVTITVSDVDGRYIADEKTDAQGKAVIRIPHQKYDVEISFLGYQKVIIKGALSHYHYQVNMERTISTEEALFYFRSFAGGLPYKVSGKKFSITRKAYFCTDPNGCMEWFHYKLK